MKIPQQIEIEIINNKNQSIEKEFLIGLKIFQDDGSYHNYSLIKTDKNGKRIITQKEIIENTELKYSENIEEFSSKKIEFYFWDCNALNTILNYYKSTENLLNKEDVNQSIIENLTQKRFVQHEVEKYIEMTKNKLTEDLKLYMEIKNVENCNYKFETEFIEDTWIDNSPKKYKLIVK